MIPATAPVYLDWTFWAFVVAALALVLSQLPPLKLLFRRGAVSVEIQPTLGVTQFLGNPNVQLHVILANTGGRPVRVRRIVLMFQSGARHFELPARGYFFLPTDQQPRLLTPFTLKPEEEWAHILNCFRPFDQTTERRSKDLIAPLGDDLRAKRAGLPDRAPDVELDPNLIRPLVQFFNEEFRWEHGEYHLTLRIEWAPGRAPPKRLDTHFRFTLFESDSRALRAASDDYRFGYGLNLKSRREMVFVTLEKTTAPVHLTGDD